MANQLLSQVGGDAIFHTNLCVSDNFKHQANKIPLFYKELINVWEKMSKFETSQKGTSHYESMLTLWNRSKFEENRFLCLKTSFLPPKV